RRPTRRTPTRASRWNTARSRSSTSQHPQRTKGTQTVTEQLPPDVIAQLTAIDPAITPELVATSWSLLKPFHDKAGYQAPKIDRDLRYGAHERHRLDVHTSGAEVGAANRGAATPGRTAP